MNGSAESSACIPVMEMTGVCLFPHGEEEGRAVPEISWSVNAGEWWAIGGPAGGGKSALLATAAGLQPPVRGVHRLRGRDLAALSEEESLQERLRIGLVFGNGGKLFSRLTVAENVALPLLYHRQNGGDGSAATVDERLAEVLTRLGVEHLAQQFPGRIGWVWRQRVALARALALRPAALFLDNPTTGLDPRQKSWWRDFLSQLSAGHELMDGSPVTLVMAVDDLRPWADRADQFALIQGNRWTPLGNRTELASSREPLLRALMAAEA